MSVIMASRADSISHPSKTIAEPISFDSDIEVVSRSRSQIKNIRHVPYLRANLGSSGIVDTYTCLPQFAANACICSNTHIIFQIISSSCGSIDCLFTCLISEPMMHDLSADLPMSLLSKKQMISKPYNTRPSGMNRYNLLYSAPRDRSCIAKRPHE